jgi:hypothetical protein
MFYSFFINFYFCFFAIKFNKLYISNNNGVAMSSRYYRTRVQSMGVKTSIEVDGQKIPLIKVMNDFIGGTVIGMLENLRDVKPTWKLIELLVDKRMAMRTYIKIDGRLVPVGGFVNNAVGSILSTLVDNAKNAKSSTNLAVSSYTQKWSFAILKVARRMY